VPAGSYTLLAVRPASVSGYAPPPAAARPTLSDQPGAWASQSLAVGDGEISNIVLTLRPGLQVSGRVQFAGTSDAPAPERFKQSMVSLSRTQPISRTNDGSASAPIDPSGTFAVRGVAPGRYILSARDFPPWTLQSVTVGRRDVTDTAIAIDGDLADIEIVFTDQPAEIAGAVSNDRNVPDANAAVFMFPADRARWAEARSSIRAFRTVRTSKTGAFSLPNVIAGEYLVAAAADEAAGDWPDARLLAKLASIASTVRVEPGQKQSVTLRMGALR
jgi:hypothetical protein